jgi:pimeloyl-ACP methyl ester carboxylesterase
MFQPRKLQAHLLPALWRTFTAIALIVAGGVIALAQAMNTPAVKNVVLVHGGFVDGSGWESVYKILTKKGYNVTVVQNPTITLADDVATTKRAIDAQDGPVILVGHSYGGVVISSAGDDPKVAGLVYICAFAADTGDSVLSLIKTAPADAPAPPILPPVDGFLFLDRQKFAASFAADVKPEIAGFMANSQVPWGLAAASGGATAAAWKSKPSWYLLTTEDRMIAPELQRFMSKRAGSKVVEVKGSHAIYVSRPEAVASIIEQAATGSPTSGSSTSGQ